MTTPSDYHSIWDLAVQESIFEAMQHDVARVATDHLLADYRKRTELGKVMTENAVDRVARDALLDLNTARNLELIEAFRRSRNMQASCDLFQRTQDLGWFSFGLVTAFKSTPAVSLWGLFSQAILGFATDKQKKDEEYFASKFCEMLGVEESAMTRIFNGAKDPSDSAAILAKIREIKGEGPQFDDPSGRRMVEIYRDSSSKTQAATGAPPTDLWGQFHRSENALKPSRTLPQAPDLQAFFSILKELMAKKENLVEVYQFLRNLKTMSAQDVLSMFIERVIPHTIGNINIYEEFRKIYETVKGKFSGLIEQKRRIFTNLAGSMSPGQGNFLGDCLSSLSNLVQGSLSGQMPMQVLNASLTSFMWMDMRAQYSHLNRQISKNHRAAMERLETIQRQQLEMREQLNSIQQFQVEMDKKLQELAESVYQNRVMIFRLGQRQDDVARFDGVRCHLNELDDLTQAYGLRRGHIREVGKINENFVDVRDTFRSSMKKLSKPTSSNKFISPFFHRFPFEENKVGEHVDLLRTHGELLALIRKTQKGEMDRFLGEVLFPSDRIGSSPKMEGAYNERLGRLHTYLLGDSSNFIFDASFFQDVVEVVLGCHFLSRLLDDFHGSVISVATERELQDSMKSAPDAQKKIAVLKNHFPNLSLTRKVLVNLVELANIGVAQMALICGFGIFEAFYSILTQEKLDGEDMAALFRQLESNEFLKHNFTQFFLQTKLGIVGANEEMFLKQALRYRFAFAQKTNPGSLKELLGLPSANLVWNEEKNEWRLSFFNNEAFTLFFPPPNTLERGQLKKSDFLQQLLELRDVLGEELARYDSRKAFLHEYKGKPKMVKLYGILEFFNSDVNSSQQR